MRFRKAIILSGGGIFLFLWLLQVSMAGPAVIPEPEISSSLKWSERMARSVIKRHPVLYRSWGYMQGLILHSFEHLWKETDDSRYLEYIKDYAQDMIDEEGTIKTYEKESFNIDNINAGKILFNLYEVTQEERYAVAIETLRHQLKWQPRTSEGGFWHKLKYPWQLWLDGAYMGSPFLAQYAKVNKEPEGFDDVALQLILMEKHMRDSETGLLYHGWNESRIQAWANPETGTSANFWGRAIGWYAMALVDCLDFFPLDHPQRPELIEILRRLAPALQNYQDKETGLWYQVVDQGAREGNYLEGSASCMYVYALAKGVNKGYLDKNYLKVAEKGYKGIIDHLIEVKEDGEVHLHQVCNVAGLGVGRDGSFEYYVNEAIRSNDMKATGPFILASLELNK